MGEATQLDHRGRDNRGYGTQDVGSTIRPRKRIDLLARSRIRKRSGWSALVVTKGWGRRIVPASVVTVVAAAASVPFLWTSINVLRAVQVDVPHWSCGRAGPGDRARTICWAATDGSYRSRNPVNSASMFPLRRLMPASGLMTGFRQ